MDVLDLMDHDSICKWGSEMTWKIIKRLFGILNGSHFHVMHLNVEQLKVFGLLTER